MLMLIDPNAALKMERAWKGGLRATSEQSGEWSKLLEDSRKRSEAADAYLEASAAGKPVAAIGDTYPRNVKVAGDVGEIRVEGILTKKPDFWSWYLYGANTTYSSITQALALLSADPSIKRVVFWVDSPGGTVDGLWDALESIKAFSKPKTVRTCYACSAGYAIAAVGAVGGKIEATNKAVEVGSVGVAVTYFVDENMIDITSSNAPNKRPDPTTPEGKAVIVKGLDAIEELFVAEIAEGRGVKPAYVTKNYGRGGTVLAEEAADIGMIDSIAKPQQRAVTAPADPVEDEGNETPVDNPEEASTKQQPSAAAQPPAAPPTNAPAVGGGAPKQKDKKMDLKTLQTEHPELYSAVFDKGKTEGKAEGEKLGAETERKRVNGHLKLGKASGDIETAYKAIESGATTADMHDDYLAASMKKSAVDTRQTETDEAGKVLNGAKTGGGTGGTGAKTAEEEVAAELEKLMGPPPAEKK